MITQKYVNDLAYKIIGCAIEVHKELGPGLLESVYEKCFIHELKLKGLHVMDQLTIPINYKGLEIDCSLKLDVLVENLVIVELKSVNEMNPIFEAQLLTYMKLTESPKGILINFNSKNIFHEGQKSFVNEFFAQLPKE